MLGYLTMPEKTREVLDADGYLFITGRLKSIIVTKGAKNIYPEEIENLLLQSPLIAECVVIGKLDKEGGEYPHAILYPNADAMKTMEAEAGKSCTDDEIKKSTAGSAVYKIPHGFDVSKVKRFLFAEAKK